MTIRVRQALSAVKLVAERPTPTHAVAVGEVARGLGLDLSGASRICAELDRVGLLTRGPAKGSYELSPRTVALSGRAAQRTAREVRYALTLAAQQTGETACIAAGPVGDQCVIDAVESMWTLHAPADIGSRIADGSPIELAARTGAFASTPVPRAATSSIEIAAPVQDRGGHIVAVVAIRIASNRAQQSMPRARHALEAARQLVERSIRAMDAPAAPPASVLAAEQFTGPSTLERVVAMLEHLAGGPDGIESIARVGGLRLDRARRLIESCRAAGIIRVGDDGRLALDWRVHGWYRAATLATLVEHGRHLVADAAAQLGLNGFITVLKGMRSVTVVEELAPTDGALRMARWLGRPCSILEADAGPTLATAFTGLELPRLFPERQNPDEVARFVRDAEEAREAGTMMLQIGESGFVSISAPVRDSAGQVAAAVCLVGPPLAVTSRRAAIESETRRVADSLTTILGHGYGSDVGRAREPVSLPAI